MSHSPFRPEDVLREMRTTVVPVDDTEVLAARRVRTVARLREVQLRASTRRDRKGSLRRRLSIAAVVMLSSAAAMAATAEVWSRNHPADPPARGSSIIQPPATARQVPVSDPPSALKEPVALAVPSRESALARHAGHARVAPSSAAGPKSTLGAENALMQSALSAAREGDDARAASVLQELLTRYPGSPLAQNAEVERFRALDCLGRTAAASREARHYLGEHARSMAEEEARQLAGEPARRAGSDPGVAEP